MMRSRRGFTLIELMIVLAVLAVILTLAAPSFYNFIMLQRLKSVSAQLTTDVQFARSEAAARNQVLRMQFSQGNAGSNTCYTIYAGGTSTSCDCRNSPVCGGGAVEIRTVALPRSAGVLIKPQTSPYVFSISQTNGAIVDAPIGIMAWPGNQFVVDTEIDSTRRLRTAINLSGRPLVCAPAGSTVTAAAC